MPPKGTEQWAIRKTDSRKKLMADLREMLDKIRPGGERIHGQLTDAQIFDWALEELHAVSQAYLIGVAQDEKQSAFYHSLKKQP
jgi:fatty acid-binding protein DegV